MDPIAAETRRRLEEAIGRLAEPQQAAVRLMHIEGRRLEDAATALGRSTEATRKLYSRAIARLSEELRGEKPA